MRPLRNMPDAIDAIVGGVIGVRGIGAVHLREIAASGIERLAIASRTASEADAENHARKLGHLVAVAASVEALAEMCDFVSVCSPNALHLDHAAICLDNGCHVLVEKPLFWQDAATQASIEKACDDIFERAEGRLTVNYPTAKFAQAYFAACGRPESVCDFQFSYQTRGGFIGDEIAVDLLPHAFSLFLEFCPFGPVAVRDKRSGENSWSADLEIGDTRCRFEFLQDPQADGSQITFAIDGQPARRVQKPVGDSFEVLLDLPGHAASPFAMENPMSSTIRSAVAICAEGTRYRHEPMRSREIMCLMASSLLG